MVAINIADLNNAKQDADHIAEIATSPALTATDRLGSTKDTVAGAVYKIAGITNRGGWVAVTAYAVKDIVSVSGTWYVCVVAHTSSGAFATDSAAKWRVYQGVTSGDLAATSGAASIGFKQSGTGSVPRTVEQKLFFEVDAEDYGAVGGGVVDDTAAWQLAVNAVQAPGSLVLRIRGLAKAYLILGEISVAGPVTIVGQGFFDIDNARGITRPEGGTWFIHGNPTGPCFRFSSNLGKGAGIEHCAFYQLGHPAPGAGWAPAVRDWVIRNENTQGTLRLNRVHFHNVYKGVLTDSAARPQYENITGQFFYRDFEFDRIYDIGKLDGLHSWTYWSEHNNVLQWMQANAYSVTLKRVDGLWMDRIFSFAHNAGICVSTSAYGGTARVIYVNGLYCDFTARALVIDATSPAHLQISNLFHLGQAWPSSPEAVCAGACGVDIAAGSNHLVQIGNYYSNMSSGASVKVAGTANQVWIDNEIIEKYDYSATGVGAHAVAATNTVRLASEPQIAKVSGAAGDMITGAAAGVVRTPLVQQFSGPDTTNRIVTAANAAGQFAAVTVEGEANAGLAVLAKGSGTVSVGSTANKLAFYGGGAGVVKGAITGSKSGSTAAVLGSLIAYLAARGLLTDSTTA